MRLFVVLCLLMHLSDSYYLPGVKMITYSKNDFIPMFVNSLTSTKTLLPVEYYKLGFCEPVKIQSESENLGEYLTANRIKTSPYKVEYLKETSCAVVCTKSYESEEILKFMEMIKDEYRVHFILDNLPVATTRFNSLHELGFPLGVKGSHEDDPTLLHNHVKIVVGYHIPADVEDGQGRIVDFAAYPTTLDYTGVSDEDRGKCDMMEQRLPPMRLSDKNALEVTWTYSVSWKHMNDRKWRTRWDVYFELGSGNDDVHWFSIINALLIVLFLSGMVAMILLRNLHRDISRYNRVPTEEERAEEREESGWKLVHADVFRPPLVYPMLFCVIIGTGVQLFGMALVTLFFAAFGFLSPSNRGNLLVAFLVLFVLMGCVGGYASSKTYKMFKGKRWQLCTTLTAFLFPGAMFTIFFMLNLLAWGAGSDAAVPFGSMVLLVVLWFGISVPLVFVGAYIGYRQPAISFPVATSNIPRPIPESEWYMATLPTAIVGGILPFGAIFVELYFVLTSLWTDKYYYVFGFLLLAFLILIGTCAEITLVLCYFQLCGEDYHWWWRAVLVSGSCGAYVWLYSLYYYWISLTVTNLIGTFLYFGYMSVISSAISLLTGMVGYYSCLWFTKKIYASIKVD